MSPPSSLGGLADFLTMTLLACNHSCHQLAFRDDVEHIEHVDFIHHVARIVLWGVGRNPDDLHGSGLSVSLLKCKVQ